MSAHILYFLKFTIFDRTESRCQALARQHRHHTRWSLLLLIIKQANQMDVIPCFFLQMFQITTADHQTEDPDSQLIRAETCVFLVKLPRYCKYWLFGKDIMFLEAWGEIVRKSLFVIFYGLFKQHGIGYQWCDHGCSWLCLHTNSTEIIVWAKSQSLLSNALYLIFIIFSLAQVLKLSNHEGKTASSSYRIPRPP